jgi:carboxymethylenebutenolidase
MTVMSHTSIQLHTADGTCPAHVFQPAGAGPWPGVLMCMDGIGIRPALFEMGERLAAAGYYVLLPDLFYRVGTVSMDAKKLFSDPAVQADWMARVLPAASTANMMRDMPTFLDHLAAQPKVRQPKFGTAGYCMGGRVALAAAGTFPDRIAAAASYHGGGLGAPWMGAVGYAGA